jgi:hypothetical protein
MKFLNNLWPWKEIARLNGEIDFLKRTLEHEQTSHNLTRASLQDHKLELIDHRSRVVQGQKDIRKLATILAMKSGITILFLFLSLSAFGQPLQRQLFTTNTLPILSSISGPMVTTNGSGKPELTFNGAGLTNITGVVVAQGTNIITRTNGQVVTVNGVTDTNVVDILLGGVTNGAINNISNWVNTIVSQNVSNAVGMISFTVDGGGLIVATNKSFWVRVPWSGTILAATLITDVSSSTGLDIWKTNYAQYPPLVANTIVASALPTMTASVKYQDTTLTGWQKSFASNDVFKFIIYSNSAATQITLNLDVRKQ